MQRLLLQDDEHNGTAHVLSGVIAEAVLLNLEKKVMKHLQPRFWTRYVGDTFVIINREGRGRFLDVLNGVCIDIQFTMEEEEEDQCLPFLDVLVTRQPDGHLRMAVHRKATHKDQILYANINHANLHNMACIRTLFGRIESHCTTADAKRKETQYLHRICQQQGYNRLFIRKCLQPRRQRAVMQQQTNRVSVP